MKKGINFIQKNPLTIIASLLAICIVLWGISSYIISKSSEEIAESYYERANESLSNKNYSAAKRLLDSIKTVVPQAYEWRHKANDLKLFIRKEEQTNTLKYIHQQLDTIATQQQQLLKEQYKNIQNKKYQNLAQYVWNPQYIQSQRSTRNHYLFQVDEQGVCYILATYKGSKAETIKHLTVTFKDGTSVACENKFSHQSNKIATGYTQSISFHGPNAYSLLESMGADKAQVSSFQMTGSKSYALHVSRTDLTAAKKMALLSRLLTAKQHWLKQQNECINELRFLEKRINKESPKQNDQQEQTEDSIDVSEPAL